jgi:hypothetical protein
MTSITQENPIRGPRLKLIKPTLLENKAPTTKSPEMAHSMCSPVHEIISCLVQEGPQKNPVPNMASNIHRLHPISSRGPMLIEHQPSHLTKGTIFPLNYTILTGHIGKRKLMFETQITTKGFEMRVFKFTAIVAVNSSNSISSSRSSTLRSDPGQNQTSPPCQLRRRPKNSENSRTRSQGHTIFHPPSTHELD